MTPKQALEALTAAGERQRAAFRAFEEADAAMRAASGLAAKRRAAAARSRAWAAHRRAARAERQAFDRAMAVLDEDIKAHKMPSQK